MKLGRRSTTVPTRRLSNFWVTGKIYPLVLILPRERNLFIIHDLCHAAADQLTAPHYTNVIMATMASQITSLTVVYATVYSDADQRKHQSSASLAFVWGIHRDRWIPRTKGQLRGKCFHLMTSSWKVVQYETSIHPHPPSPRPTTMYHKHPYPHPTPTPNHKKIIYKFEEILSCETTRSFAIST